MIVVSRAARRSIVWAPLAAFGPAASDTLAQSALPFRIPDFCATATITSAASGPWSSPATWSPNRIPIAGDVVRINNGHIVTYDAVADVAIARVGIHGALRFRTDINTRLKVGTLMAMPDRELTVGTPSTPVAPNVVAELVIANQPLDASRDPEQFGTALIGLGRVTMHGADDAVWDPVPVRFFSSEAFTLGMFHCHRATLFL
jgi:G8 domain-containing protein